MKTIDSLYIHFPWCEHICNYCDFYKNVLPKDQRTKEFKQFEVYLEESWTKHAEFLKSHNLSFGKIKTVFIGGGTPSLWGAYGIKYLRKLFKKYDIELASDIEFTMEANPSSASGQDLNKLLEYGVTRFSVGMQSFDQRFLKVLDRVHSIDDGEIFLNRLNKLKVNFSIDFMIGLPFSKEYKRDLIGELKKALSFNPAHISVYILTTKDNYCHADNLPDEDYISEEYLLMADFLKSEGFDHYEVSNFAREKKQCLHNLNYWNAEQVAALGPSGTGFVYLGENQGLRYKWKNRDSKFDTEILNKEALDLEKFYLSLRTNVGVSLSNDSERLLAKSWVNRGLAFRKESKVVLNSKGYLVLDALMGEYFVSVKD